MEISVVIDGDGNILNEMNEDDKLIENIEDDTAVNLLASSLAIALLSLSTL